MQNVSFASAGPAEVYRSLAQAAFAAEETRLRLAESDLRNRMTFEIASPGVVAYSRLWDNGLPPHLASEHRALRLLRSIPEGTAADEVFRLIERARQSGHLRPYPQNCRTHLQPGDTVIVLGGAMRVAWLRRRVPEDAVAFHSLRPHELTVGLENGREISGEDACWGRSAVMCPMTAGIIHLRRLHRAVSAELTAAIGRLDDAALLTCAARCSAVEALLQELSLVRQLRCHGARDAHSVVSPSRERFRAAQLRLRDVRSLARRLEAQGLRCQPALLGLLSDEAVQLTACVRGMRQPPARTADAPRIG